MWRWLAILKERDDGGREDGGREGGREGEKRWIQGGRCARELSYYTVPLLIKYLRHPVATLHITLLYIINDT